MEHPPEIQYNVDSGILAADIVGTEGVEMGGNSDTSHTPAYGIFLFDLSCLSIPAPCSSRAAARAGRARCPCASTGVRPVVD